VRRVRLEDLLASPEELSRLRDLFARGGVAAIPTETFYALAADPKNATAVARIARIKGRDFHKPFLVLFSDRLQLSRLGVDADSRTLDFWFGIWPAPITVVFRLEKVIAASRGSPTIAVRLPAAPELLNLLATVGALTGTSANRSGRPALDDPDDVAEQLGAELDLLIDGGRTPGGQPSTLVDATQEPPVVLRAGAFPWPPEEPPAH
jgi:L-threonylcarbamoyladenylate synthase